MASELIPRIVPYCKSLNQRRVPASSHFDSADGEQLLSLSALAANPIDGYHRDINGSAAIHGALPRRVYLVSGLDDISQRDRSDSLAIRVSGNVQWFFGLPLCHGNEGFIIELAHCRLATSPGRHEQSVEARFDFAPRGGVALFHGDIQPRQLLKSIAVAANGSPFATSTDIGHLAKEVPHVNYQRFRALLCPRRLRLRWIGGCNRWYREDRAGGHRADWAQEDIFVTIATVVFGAALLIQGNAVGLLKHEFPCGRVRANPAKFGRGGGILALFLTGAAGIARWVSWRLSKPIPRCFRRLP